MAEPSVATTAGSLAGSVSACGGDAAARGGDGMFAEIAGVFGAATTVVEETDGAVASGSGLSEKLPAPSPFPPNETVATLPVSAVNVICPTKSLDSLG